MKSTLALLLLTTTLVAAEPRRLDRLGGERGARARHFILEAQHVLSESDRGDLAARGAQVQRELAGGRYLVRIAPGSTVDANDLRVRSLEPLTIEKKLHPSAYREAARGRAFARLHVMFHDDVTFEAARAAIDEHGGTPDEPLALDFEWPQRIVARVPSSSLLALGQDERVFVVQGAPRLRAEPHNATAATLSNASIVHAPPYGLTGQGVVISYFELAPADAAHPEFGGRLTVHATPCPAGDSGCQSNAQHATHVGGTMVASGVDARAKGMAPAAALHQYIGNEGSWLNDKDRTLTEIGSVADNNSWGYVFGWRQSGPAGWTWNEGDEYIGGYDLLAATLDRITRKNGVLMVHSSGNSAALAGPSVAPFRHHHVNDEGDPVTTETYCYSPDGSGNDCPATDCTAGAKFCETVRHPVRSPHGSVGLMASAKNVIAVGAITSLRQIANFSSRGPTRDGRVKPDLVAKGVGIYSTLPNNLYAPMQGTSMSSPVVTGIAALAAEQWKKTFGGGNPTAPVLKALLIGGAQDAGNQGPDYTYGYGIVDAKGSVDLIIADGGTGKRVRTGSAAQGAQFEYGLTVAAPQELLRIVLVWPDPEVLLLGDELADKTLVNDLDLKVVDPGGTTVLPFVLDKNNPAQFPARAVNTVDNAEVVEIRNAAAGTYRIVVAGTRVTASPPQQFVMVANAEVGAAQPVCVDANEPNDAQSAAFGYLASGQTVSGRICSASDVDFFKVRVNAAGAVRATVAATGTPLRVTLVGSSGTLATADVAAGSSATVEAAVTAAAGDVFVKIEPSGTLGSDGSYTLTVTYPFATTPRRRAS